MPGDLQCGRCEGMRSLLCAGYGSVAQGCITKLTGGCGDRAPPSSRLGEAAAAAAGMRRPALLPALATCMHLSRVCCAALLHRDRIRDGMSCSPTCATAQQAHLCSISSSVIHSGGSMSGFKRHLDPLCSSWSGTCLVKTLDLLHGQGLVGMTLSRIAA